MITGGAIVTTKQESARSIMFQTPELTGPPKYYTYDWKAASDSVKRLADLNPSLIAPGHGKPMSGEQMKNDLQDLAEHFNELAVPKHGRYLEKPAVADETGIIYVPPRTTPLSWLMILILFILIMSILMALYLTQ